MPDLTKNQRKRAYDLRTERRAREEKGEQNLKISSGKIITIKENGGGGTASSSIQGCPSVAFSHFFAN